MNMLLIYGVIVGAAFALVAISVVVRLRQVNAYERAIKVYLGHNVGHYDEDIMLAYYDGAMNASDAAREMTAIGKKRRYNDPVVP